jgi:osmoprotectant transport system ATP-binding protein
VIEYRDVTLTRGHRQVLRRVSLVVRAGEVVALVGRSGSGKTTMLRLVNRMLEVQQGYVAVHERSVGEWDPITLRRRTGYVIQEVGLFPHLTVRQNIGLVPRLLGWTSEQIAGRCDQLLTDVGLSPDVFADRWPDQLSGGQRQRVGLARALAVDPPVLLMDEPFGALDAITRAELHRKFHALQTTYPRTVLLVTHDLNEARALADRVAVLHDGEIVACAAPDDLPHVAVPAVQELLSSSRA